MPAAPATQMLRVFLTASFLSSGLLALALTSGCQSAPSEEDNRLVFFNWWTSPGELAALDRMVAVFSGRFPDVKVENAVVTGGPATDLHARLYDQGLKAGHPPDSYQVHIGAEAQADLPYLQPIDDLYASNGWAAVFPQPVLENTRFNGSYYTVPLNVHRSNVLWYRKDSLAAVEKAPPTTWVEFFELAETLKAAGEEVFVYNPARDAKNPGNRVSWTTHHMFESILLAEVGGDRWLGLFDGTFSWTAPQVLEAFSKLKRLLTYAKPMPDGPGYDLTAMTTEDRPAAMALMGDWAEGDLTALGFQPDRDFGWIAAPGTSDYFLFLSDSFPLPKGAPHERNGRRWLEVVGSREGQDAFNPAKGSIPARLDADRSLYDAYHQAAIAEFAGRKLIPSLAHGLAANLTFKSRYYEIIGQFVDDGDAAAAATALSEACTPACQ